MNTRSVYDRVCLTNPVEQNKFVQFFNDSVRSLVGVYDSKYVFEEDTCDYSEIMHINDMSGVRDIYAECITDNVLYLVSGDNQKRVDFVNKADMAYKTVWRTFAKYRRRHGEIW